MTAKATRVSAGGEHDRTTYVRLVQSICGQSRSGTLTIEFGRRFRKLCFLEGSLVAYDSNIAEDGLDHTLVNARLLPKKRMKWVVDKLEPGETLRDALVMSGAVTVEQLDEHNLSRLKVDIGTPLLWPKGTWRFQGLAGTLSQDRVDPKLRPEIASLAALWHGVRQHVSMDEVLPAVMDTSGGKLLLSPDFAERFASYEVEEAFAQLAEAVGEGSSVDDLASKIPDRSGNLVKLLWMLESGGVLEREKADPVVDLLTSSSASPPKAKGTGARSASKKKTSAPKAEAASQVASDASIAEEHAQRMGQDYFSFLGLEPDTQIEMVKRTCKRLAQRWRKSLATGALTGDEPGQVEELLLGLQVAWRTLTEQESYDAYRRALEEGRAQQVEALKKARPPGKKGGKKSPVPPEVAEEVSEEKMTESRRFMMRGEFQKAISLLKAERLENPSSPDVLADLGWATWKLGSQDDDETPDEFLRLALTFDPKHSRALEFLARIAIDQGDHAEAQDRLERFLSVKPDAGWARTALATVKDLSAVSTSKGGRFWRRGGSS